MCHRSVHEFFRNRIAPAEIEGRRVLEVGSRDVNGSVRPFLTSLGARDYLGVDLVEGPGVDRVLNVDLLDSGLEGERFDVVVTTEMLEHVRDWRGAVSNLKRVVAPGGLLVITTRSFGFPYHDFPGDYWRYEVDDMRAIFSDLDILSLVPDPQCPGVFLKGRKPADFREREPSLDLFSVIRGERAGADAVDEDEIRAYANRMGELTEIGSEVTRILWSVDIADVGRRDFSNLWRSFDGLASRIEGLAGGRVDSRRDALSRLRRRLLEWATHSRMVRGGAFLSARQSLLKSTTETSGTAALRIPWALIDEETFLQIRASLQSIRDLCVKIESYARPRPPA